MDRLGVDTNAYDLDTIFSEKFVDGEIHCVQRVRFAVHVYFKWIQYIKSLENEDEDQRIDINDLMENELPGKYSFIDLQVDFGRILRNNDLLKVDGNTVNDENCNESECYILRRHERPKDWYSRNGDRMDSLFFMSANEDDARRSVVVQQSLDSVHHYLEHRETIDLEKVIESIHSVDRQSERNGHDGIDVDSLLDDQFVIALDREIKDRKISGRYRGRNRGIETGHFNKFMSTNNYQSAGNNVNHSAVTTVGEHEQESKDNIDVDPKPDPKMQQEAEEEIECEDCFVEKLYNELILHGVDVETVRALRRFVEDQQFDTDSVIADCDSNVHSERNGNGYDGHRENSSMLHLLHSLTNLMHIDIDRIIDEFAFDYRSKTEEYSAGYRFYYWPFYKNNDAEYVRVFGKTNDQDPGYKLGDWYIDCKFGSFKEEILSNQKSGFSMRDWSETMTKAEMKWAAYRKNKNNRPLIRATDSFKRLYGIEGGDKATISHIMALLFYTNYSKACYEFSASFRKKVWNETDHSLKIRHSYFGHQGRLLRELVECFGNTMSNCAVRVYYHGINRDLIFKSTQFHLHGPLSTTSEFEVAHGTFSKSNGIVVDILRGKGKNLFEALLWSDYHEESEYFFIGGLQAFKFVTIHDIPKKRDYKSYIGPITMFQQMTRGFKFNQNGRAITKFDAKILDRLITDNLSEAVTSKIPVYIRRLFANFTNNVQRVEINMTVMNNTKEKVGFRFGPMRHLFIADSDTERECISLPLFAQLFNRSLQSIVIFRNGNVKKPCIGSILLNSECLDSLLSVCKEISSNPLLRKEFQSIIIMRPKDSTSQFIAERQSDFKPIGWKLEQKGYQHPRRRYCPETLHIYRV